LGDYCVIDVLSAAGDFERVAAAHHDPAKAPLVERLRQYTPDRKRPSLQTSVLRTGKPIMLNGITEDAIVTGAADAEHAAIGRALAPSACMVVPLSARNRTLGTILLAAQGERRYGDAHVSLAVDLAQRAGLAVDNALLYRQAQDAIKIREQFLSIAAHELKTPLTSLLGYAGVFNRRVHRSGKLEERDERALATIIVQGERLNTMIGSLLDITRIQTGRLAIERRPLDLRAVLETLVHELEPTLDQHTIALECASASLPLMGDELRLEQVFRNLLGNAVKYSPQGGVVRVHISQQGEEAVVAVSDDGVGIPAAALPHLFERFYRAANSDQHQISGIGIGLYVVQEIVTLHGGTVDVASQEDVGSTFTVRLPIV
ncbi:MAG: GAF domain-containing sensor histidine kinase, partial [Chloroflexales bacterium]|nr:GAF domain-containing sensor histidine kinase [Chloroflexales bacterium]